MEIIVNREANSLQVVFQLLHKDSDGDIACDYDNIYNCELLEIKSP